jgi:hypothetical protein
VSTVVGEGYSRCPKWQPLLSPDLPLLVAIGNFDEIPFSSEREHAQHAQEADPNLFFCMCTKLEP